MKYAVAHDITFDDELYYVSAMLHDLALTHPFDSHRVAFEEAGGDLAWAFGWRPADRGSAGRADHRAAHARRRPRER